MDNTSAVNKTLIVAGVVTGSLMMIRATQIHIRILARDRAEARAEASIFRDRYKRALSIMTQEQIDTLNEDLTVERDFNAIIADL